MTSIARFARPLDRLAVRIDPLAVSEGDAKLLREGAEFCFLVAELLLAIEELHRLLLDDLHAVLDVLLPLVHRGRRWAGTFLEFREPRFELVNFGLQLRGLRGGFTLIGLQRSFLPFEDLGPGVQPLLHLLDPNVTFPELLLAIKDLERLLLEEPEILRDFGLHRVGLDAEPFRIAPRGARAPEVIVDTASRDFRFMAGLLEIPEPFRKHRVARREVGLARDQLGLARGGLLAPGPQVPILLSEVLHEVVRSLQFRRDGPLLRPHFLELLFEVRRLPLTAFL